MRRYPLLAMLCICGLLACSDRPESPPDSVPTTGKRADEAGLQKSYAAHRAMQIDDVRYRLHVDLDPALEQYMGTNTLSFAWTGTASELTIDFSAGEVDSIIVNGSETEFQYNGHFIRLHGEDLLTGRNEITVNFRHAWGDGGVGLYRYDDPDDGKSYLYTDFEPFDANRAFPLFDQPDIKARFTLSVTAPNDWHVISTDREISKAAQAPGRQTWRFPETAPIPTYIMSLHAGPYAVWEDSEYRIPLRLFARQSLARYVAPDTERWFDTTRKGFDYFEDYFGIPYPFSKNDYVIVPDFNSGAMENAGAITVNENGTVQRNEWSYPERRWLSKLILHELAHMWFGNLVTMTWWDGLWLNETFAEFMGYRAAAVVGITDSWQSFYLDRKFYAYWLDQRQTTHPVQMPVDDAFNAASGFDMISYAKGAASLRQLEFRIGETAFRSGIRHYLEQHAFANATLEDLIAAMSAAAEEDIDDWATDLIRTAGANTIEAHFDCAAGKVTAFRLLQGAPAANPFLRTQKVNIGLFRDIDSRVLLTDSVPAVYTGETTDVPAAVGADCPDLVYPNYGDMAYVLVRLDARTRDNLAPMIGRIDDSFQRAMFWQSLWDSVRFAEIPVTDYLDAVFASAAEEDDIQNADQVYAFVGTSIAYLIDMQEQGASALAAYRPRAEALAWANVVRTRGDLQTMYLDRYLGFASSPEALEHLVGLLDGSVTIPDRELDQDRRWAILVRLSAAGHARSSELFNAERLRDPSDGGRRAAIRVEAAMPDADVKRRFLADITDKRSATPLALQRLAMGSLFPRGQEALHEAFADEILEHIAVSEQEADPAYYRRARTFAAYLIPTTCTAAGVARLEAAIDAHENSRKAIREYLIERHEDTALCMRRAALLAR